MAINPSQISCEDTYDSEGESFTRLTICTLPAAVAVDEINEWVEACFPAQRCTHSYDCCGHHYPRRAIVVIDTEKAQVNVSQCFILNI